MSTSRGIDRLLAFGDATVAIAMTLLVLPLVDVAQEVDGRPVGELLDDHSFEIVSFALSFVVIAAFWRVHHSLYDDVERSTRPLVTANLVWLATIVFLPFPTALLASPTDQRLTHGIYIGTLVVASATLAVQRHLIVRDGGAESSGAGALVSTGLLVVALVVAVGIPAIGMWALLVLLLERPIRHVIAARA